MLPCRKHCGGWEQAFCFLSTGLADKLNFQVKTQKTLPLNSYDCTKLGKECKYTLF